MTEASLEEKADDAIQRLKGRIASYDGASAVVAVSGGVDSAVVLVLAAQALGTDAVTAVTAVSPSYAAGELEEARRVAGSISVRHVVIATQEVQKDQYARNDALRCFHCKVELYASLKRLASDTGGRTIILAGANVDDVADFRPGLLAATRFTVRNPLLDEHVDKSMVRAIARSLGLSVADKPALACLASRVAYGIRVTPELLLRIDRAERAVRALGFASVRVRHFGDVAKIELPTGDIGPLAEHKRLPALSRYLRILGWRHITLDLDGLRSGSMNATLTIRPSLRRRIAVVSDAGRQQTSRM